MATFRVNSLVSWAGLFSLALIGSQPLFAQSVAGTMPEDYLPELKPILAKSLTLSPNTVLSNIAISQAEAAAVVSDSPLWPYFGGNVSYGYNGSAVDSAGKSSTSSSTGLTYHVGFSQPVYQFGALKARSDAGRVGVLIAQQQYAEAYRVLLGLLRTQYLGLVTNKIVLRNAQYRLKAEEASLAAKEGRLKTGELTEGDLNGPRLDAGEARLVVDRASVNLANNKRLFAHLAGLSDIPDSAIADMVPKPEFGYAATSKAILNKLKGGGVDETPLVKNYALYAEQSDLIYKSVKTGLYPKFALSAGYDLQFYNQVASATVSQTALRSYNVGLTMSWTIFDGFSTRGQKLQALHNKRYYDRYKQNQAETFVDTADVFASQLELSARSMSFADTRSSLQRAAVQLTIDQSKQGAATEQQVTGANITYQAADAAATAVRVEFMSKWADFVSVAGFDPMMENLPASYRNAHGK